MHWVCINTHYTYPIINGSVGPGVSGSRAVAVEVAVAAAVVAATAAAADDGSQLLTKKHPAQAIKTTPTQ